MNKTDRIIQIIREMMVANAAGTQGGFSGSSDPQGPVAGFDPVSKFVRRGKVDYRKVPKDYKKWIKSLGNK